jgi:ribosomal protein S27AE
MARKQMTLPMPLPARAPGPPRRLKVPRTKGVPLEHDRPACPKCGPGFAMPADEHARARPRGTARPTPPCSARRAASCLEGHRGGGGAGPPR